MTAFCLGVDLGSGRYQAAHLMTFRSLATLKLTRWDLKEVHRSFSLLGSTCGEAVIAVLQARLAAGFGLRQLV